MTLTFGYPGKSLTKSEKQLTKKKIRVNYNKLKTPKIIKKLIARIYIIKIIFLRLKKTDVVYTE